LAEPGKSTPSSAELPAALRGAPIVNIVIDVGDFDGKPEDRAAHDAYIKKINESVEALRKEGIPTVFIAITDEHQVHEKLDAETRKTLKLTELDVRPGDIVFEKRFMSGFPTLEDIRNSPELEKYIISQRGVEHGGADFAKAFDKTDVTLKHLLHDAQHVTIMGAMAQYCVTDNACDAAWHGKRVTVFSDTTTAWSKETMELYEKRARGEATDPEAPRTMVRDNPAFQEEQIKAAIGRKKSNPASMGRKPEEVKALDNIGISTVQQFLGEQPGLKSSLQKPVTLSGSKFLTPKETSSFTTALDKPGEEQQIAHNSTQSAKRRPVSAPKFG
jgi:nicotinamidase-related amidase